MLRHTFALTALMAASGAGLAGCASSPDLSSGAHGEDLTPTQLAAFSAKAHYPETRPDDSFRSAALVSRDKGTIKIYNFGDRPIGDAKVWVNHSFVYHILGIAPQSKVVIKADQLYNSLGNSLASVKEDVSSVQLQTPDGGFFNVAGPAMD